MNLADILRVRAREKPHMPALVEGVETVDWETLHKRSLGAAWKLREVGVAPGHHVALSSRSNIAYVVLSMAIARLGAACCGLDWRMQSAERAGTSLACLFSSSDEFEAEVVRVRREQGAYRRHGRARRPLWIAALVATLALAFILI